MPAPNFSRPKPVLMIDCRCEKRRPSLLSPDNAFREMMTSGAAYESSSFCGRLLGTLPSSGSVELAATAAAAGPETAARSSPVNLVFTHSHVTPSPGARGSARRPRAATDTPPEWQHADDVPSYLAASVPS